MAATVVLFFFPPASWGSETDTQTEPWEKYGIQAGYFLSAVDSGVRLGTGAGVDIDVEGLLGLDSSSSVFRVGALWRFTENRRHRLDFSWFSLKRDGTRRVIEDFSFENKDGFDTMRINVETEDEDWPGIDLDGKVNFNYAGMQLYLRFFY